MTDKEQKEHDAIVNSDAPKEMSEALTFIKVRMRGYRTEDCLPEIIYSALQAMKENPTISIQRAIEIGCEEWDV